MTLRGLACLVVALGVSLSAQQPTSDPPPPAEPRTLDACEGELLDVKDALADAQAEAAVNAANAAVRGRELVKQNIAASRAKLKPEPAAETAAPTK